VSLISEKQEYLQRLKFAYVSLGMGWTEVVRFLILTNITIFAVQQIFGLDAVLAYNFGLVPAAFFAGRLWQLVTYMFLHAGFMHIFFNMLALWMFGSVLEREWGSREFLKYYLLTGLGGGLCYALFNMNSTVPTVGASGAIYGLLVAYAVLFPESIIYVYFVIPLKAKWLAVIFGGIEFVTSFAQGSGIAHLAHLGGMAVGYVYLKRHRWFRGARGWSDWKERREYEKRRREEETLDDIRREVDELLDKINHVGMNGLSKSEQKRLEKYSRILRERERERQ
jgi:membrane associated rhomboid family serine protease